jgi:predicted phage tail protein
MRQKNTKEDKSQHMTNIILHGILAKEFQPSFRMKIHKAANVVKAIDANRTSFSKRISDLAREGLNYAIIVDGRKITELEELNIQKEPQEIHLVPLIVGAGAVLGAAILVGAGKALGAIGLTALGGFVGGLATSAVVSGIVGGLVMTTVSMGLQMLLAPKPDAGAPISAATKALTESFSFSNKANVASQGTPVPVGYGRLKVGSQLIQMSIKSYPQSQTSTTAMRQNPYVSKVAVENETEQSISNLA